MPEQLGQNEGVLISTPIRRPDKSIFAALIRYFIKPPFLLHIIISHKHEKRDKLSKETPYIFAKNQIRMILRKGKDNAISRSMLKQITGMDDRTNRLIIEDLRCEGIPVMSSSSDKGYWLPQTVSEVEHYINENRHRAREISLMAGRAEAWLREHADELED